MGASQSTPNIHLPLFTATDKPSWLGDVNEAHNKTDAAIAELTAQLNTLTAQLNVQTARITALATATGHGGI